MEYRMKEIQIIKKDLVKLAENIEDWYFFLNQAGSSYEKFAKRAIECLVSSSKILTLKYTDQSAGKKKDFTGSHYQ